MNKLPNRKILDVSTEDESIEIYDDKIKNINRVNKTKKIPNSIKNSNYIRPEITYTDKLSKKEIESLLIDYEQVNDLNDVPQGTYIRYFEDKDGVMKFRIGGILTIKTGLPDYCILYNNKVSWSVQIKKCIFFRRITIEEIKREYKDLLDKKDRDIAELQSFIKKLTKDNIQLKKQLSLKNKQPVNKSNK